MSTITTRGWLAAGALMLALASPAISAETTGRSVASDPIEAWDTGRASGDVPFPQLPWMTTTEPATAEGLLGPQIETLGPFLLEPALSTRFSANGSAAPQGR